MSDPEVTESEPEARIKILVVDDEDSVLHAISEILGQNGFDCKTASDGRSALEQIEQFEPDLIILDIVMPGIDGFTVLEQIKNRQEPRDIPVILLSGLDEDGKIWEGYNLGASYYITKPFTTDELLAGIQLMLE